METERKNPPPDPGEEIERFRILREQDWERLTLVLLKYAARRFHALGILVSNGSIRGTSINDLVQDAVASLWSERRSWDYKSVPLKTFLQNAVSSNISNLLDRYDVKHTDQRQEDSKQNESLENIPPNEQANPGHDHARHLSRRPRDPEEILIENEELEHQHDLILEAADDDKEIIRYLDTIDHGTEKPINIAKEWGVEIRVIYNVENRLRNNLKKIKQRQNKPSSDNNQ